MQQSNSARERGRGEDDGGGDKRWMTTTTRQMKRGSAWVEAAQGAMRRPLVFIFYQVKDKLVVVSPLLLNSYVECT
jgi:hypothetical protein